MQAVEEPISDVGLWYCVGDLHLPDVQRRQYEPHQWYTHVAYRGFGLQASISADVDEVAGVSYEQASDFVASLMPPEMPVEQHMITYRDGLFWLLYAYWHFSRR
jgi:hypothetical protein